MGKGEALEKLWEGLEADRWQSHLLAEFLQVQMQTEVNQNNTVPDQNEENYDVWKVRN